MKEPDAIPQQYAMDDPAGIEFRGVAGSTRCCVDAVYQLIQCRVVIANTLILTCNGSHGLLIETEYGDKIAIKTGFASGYQGTGPPGFSKIVHLLHELDIEIDEVLVPQDLLDRLDQSALLRADLDWLAEAPRKRPLRLYDYVRKLHLDAPECQQPWWDFEPVMPFALIDDRLSDLAGGFFAAPDEALFKGFRRLESLVRKRIESKRDGARLFTEAFQGEASKLIWKDLPDAERIGRANLFIGAYSAHRNPRFHQEETSKADEQASLSEFLTLNHLFRLERDAIARPEDEYPKPSKDADNQAER